MIKHFSKLTIWSFVIVTMLMSSLSFGQFVPDPTKWYRIVFFHSDKCIRPVNGYYGNNIQLEQSTINENDQSQLWKFKTGRVAGYWYPVNANGKAFDIYGTAAGSYVGTWDMHSGYNQQFRFDPSRLGDYYYMIDLRSYYSGTDLTLDVENGSTSDGAKILTWNKKISEYGNQVVKFVEVTPKTFIPDPEKWYRMIFLHSGKCMRPTGNSAGNVQIEQWPVTMNDKRQLWKFKPGIMAGYWYPINNDGADNDGKAFDIYGTVSGSYVGTWDMHSGDNQQFRFDPCLNSNYYFMVDLRSTNQGTNLTLDVEGASKTDGAKVLTWTKKASGYENQVVKFIENSYYDKLCHSYTLTTKDLTYRIDFTDKPTMITNSEIEKAMQLTCAIWSSSTNLSFKQVTTGGDILIQFKPYCTYAPGVAGESAYTIPATITIFCAFNNGNLPINYTFNEMMALLLHEVGHPVGFHDMIDPWITVTNPWDLVVGGNSYFSPPSPRASYQDKMYWDWRMQVFGSGFGDLQRPANYEPFKDISPSIMDYDAFGGGKYMYNHVGIWGRIYPDEYQPRYLSQYDVDLLQEKYGIPEYLPIISMVLMDYYFPTPAIYQTQSYATTSWDDANGKCREFLKPSDIRNLEGLVPNAPTTGCVLMFRHHRTFTNGSGILAHDYCLSTQQSLAGWTREASLGYWRQTPGSITMTIGTKSKSHPTIPIYQYTKAGVGHTFTAESWTDGWDGWQKETLGYIVPLSEITNP